jgi:hypothetical protein
MNGKSNVTKTIIIELFDDDTAVIWEQDYENYSEINGTRSRKRFTSEKKDIEAILNDIKKVNIVLDKK